jgi:hypothetical protein
MIVPGFGLSPAYVGTRTPGFQGDVAEINVPTDQEIAAAIAANRNPPAAAPKVQVAKKEPKVKVAKKEPKKAPKSKPAQKPLRLAHP